MIEGPMLGGGYDDDYVIARVPHRRGGRHRRVSSYCCGGGGGGRRVSLSSLSSSHSLTSSFNNTYDLLPQFPLKLTVSKLDGSFFEIEVAKTATVAEVKQAVEEVFNNKHRKGHGKISWAHVWGHFCLCYDGWKLLVDNECLQDYMINDGDQLYFVQHISANTFSFGKQSKEKLLSLEQPKTSSCNSDCFLETEKITEKEEDISNNHGSSPSQYGGDENTDMTTRYEFKFAQILGRWFSYRRLGSSKRKAESRDFSSKIVDTVSGGFKSIMRFCSSNKLSSRRDTFEEI